MATASENDLPAETRLAHYVIRRPLGAGAMGHVYEAYDTALDRPVAVKVLRPEIAEDADTVERFVREARAAARVNHPNLTHVYFVGEEGRSRFFAMELLPGRTLEDLVADEGPLDLATAVDVLVQAARGLGAAHGADVVHRDVKPGNLMRLPDGTVKVTDFGLAKSVTGETDVTGAGRILGTPRYMSPEQCRGEPLDARTDVYSLGLLGHFLLAGSHPFCAENIGKLLDEQMNAPLPDLAPIRPDLSPAVGRALSRLAAKRREGRPATMAEAIAILEEIRPRRLDLAPMFARGAALGIDLLAISAAVSGLTFVFQLAFGQSPVETYPVASNLLFTLVLYVTQAGLEARTGTTLGKRLLFLKVVREDGSRPGLGRTSTRFLLRLPIVLGSFSPPDLRWAELTSTGLQILAIAAGIVCYLALRRRSLSDVVTKTRVVFASRSHDAAPARKTEAGGA